MKESLINRSGRHFLQIPGPSNVPERVLRAIDRAIIDHRGPDFAKLTFRLLEKLKWIFKTSQDVIIYPSSGTGAWEAALVNVLNPGDKILAYETGFFATMWKQLAETIGFQVDWVESNWRHGVDLDAIKLKLEQDTDHTIKAVMVVHNETSNGITSNLFGVRKVLDSVNHPALLLADIVSSLGTCDYRHDEWGVDVAICASQKGLMLPPGLGFNVISEKAKIAAKKSKFKKYYWSWEQIMELNKKGFYPYTPASGLFTGLDESLDMLQEEGLEAIFKRHDNYSKATRIALDHWGLENYCMVPEQYSQSVTAILIPDGYDADQLMATILERFNMSLGSGLGKLKGKVFRIGHLGDLNELTLLGTLAGVEMGLELCGVPFNKGGVQLAMNFFTSSQT